MTEEARFTPAHARSAAQRLEPVIRDWYRKTINFITTEEFQGKGEEVMHSFEHGFEDLLNQLSSTLYERGVVWDENARNIGINPTQSIKFNPQTGVPTDADFVKQYQLFIQKLKPWIEEIPYDPAFIHPVHEVAFAVGKMAALMKRDLHVAIAPLGDAGFNLSEPTAFLQAFKNAVSLPDLGPNPPGTL